MKKGRDILIGGMVILFMSTFLIINNGLSEGDKSEVPPTISSQQQVENERKVAEIENFIYGDRGIIKQANDELVKKGYQFQTLVMANSVDDVQVKFIFTNKEATELEESVKSIFFEIVKKNKLDENVFTLKVANRDDGPDW